MEEAQVRAQRARRIITLYQLAVTALSTALIILGVIPWKSLLGLAELQVRLSPPVLGLGVFLLALIMLDIATGLIVRLAAYPTRRMVLAASLAMMALAVVSAGVQLQRGQPMLALVGALPAVPGAWLLLRLKRRAEERPEEPRGLLRYVIPAVLGLTGLGERLAEKLGILEAADRAGLRWTRLEAAALASLLLILGVSGSAVLLGAYALTGLTILLLLAPLPLLALPTLRVHLEAKSRERARQAEEELPYLSLWAWLLERSGAGSLEDALEEARRSGLLPALGADIGKSLEELARRHPSRRLRRFYSHYLAIRDTGGDVAALLSDTLRAEIDELRARILSYGDNGYNLLTGFLGAVMFAVLFVPVALLTGSSGAAAFAAAALLLLAPAGYLLLNAVQPRLRERYEDAKGAAAAAAAASAAALLASLAALPSVLAAGAAAAAGLAAYGAFFRAQRRLVAREERELLPLLRMVIEYTRSMSDQPVAKLLEQAVVSVEEPLAGAARAAARTGEARARSWLARYTLHTVVNLIGRLGAADPYAMEKLYDLVYAHVSAYRAAGAKLKAGGVFAVILSPVVVAMTAVTERIAGAAAAPLLATLPLAFTGSITATVAWVALAAALAAGVLSAKAISLTLRDTLWPLAAVLSTLAAILFFHVY